MFKKIHYTEHCTAPWEQIILNSDLSYCPCCFGSSIGKISNVEDILHVWNSEGYRSIRRGLLNGNPVNMCLDCNYYKVIRNMKLIEVESNWIRKYNSDICIHKPSNIQLLMTERCNCNCIMCNLKKDGYDRVKNGLSIPFEFIEKLGETYFDDLEVLNPNCAGELSMYERFDDFLTLLENHRPKTVIFNTSGNLSLSDFTWLRILKTHDLIGFSLDSCSNTIHNAVRGFDFDIAINNIKKIKDIKSKYNLKFRLTFNFVIMKINLHEMFNFVKMAVETLGATDISITHVSGHDDKSVIIEKEWSLFYNDEIKKVKDYLKRTNISRIEPGYSLNSYKKIKVVDQNIFRNVE